MHHAIASKVLTRVILERIKEALDKELTKDQGTVSQKHRKSYVVRNCDVSSS